MSIIKAKISITGTRTLAWHYFGPDSLPLEAREKSGVAGNDPTEWRRTVLIDEERRLYLPPTYFFGCIKNAGKTVKRGKGTLLAAIASTLQIYDDRVFISDESGILALPQEPEVINAFSRAPEQYPPAYVEVIGVRNPSTKARNIRYRVCARPGWKCSFTAYWDATVVSRQDLKLVITNAGDLVGIGDGRGSIGYGRFKVESFDVIDA